MFNLKVEFYLKFIFIISFVAIIAAYFIEYVLGHQPCNLCLIERIPYGLSLFLIIINFIWIAICIYAYFMETSIQFYAAAGVVGLVMGGIQALSRSTYSKFLPETRDTTSYFSFYDVSEKIGIVIGMLIYGFIDQITGSMRNSVLFLIVFFGVGVILLFRVPKK